MPKVVSTRRSDRYIAYSQGLEIPIYIGYSTSAFPLLLLLLLMGAQTSEAGNRCLEGTDSEADV